MHKIFAKPLFLGKKVIFLTECHSTNDELTVLAKKEDLPEGTVILTDHQKKGKGQRGNVWFDEPGKNLLVSFLLKPSYLLVSQQYLLNVAVGLGVLRCAARYIDESKLHLKWPNDLLVENRKISGVLIENMIKGSLLENSIVGIGFNLNQKAFNLPHATSLFLEINDMIERNEFAENLLSDIEFFLFKLKSGDKEELIQEYHEKLYQRDVEAIYRDVDGKFTGIIEGVDHTGRLKVSREGIVKSFGLKEIEFLS